MRRCPGTGRLDRAEPLADPARTREGDVMRTLRVILTGTVTVVLISGLPGVIMAQDDVETGPVTHSEPASGGPAAPPSPFMPWQAPQRMY